MNINPPLFWNLRIRLDVTLFVFGWCKSEMAKGQANTKYNERQMNEMNLGETISRNVNIDINLY